MFTVGVLESEGTRVGVHRTHRASYYSMRAICRFIKTRTGPPGGRLVRLIITIESLSMEES